MGPSANKKQFSLQWLDIMDVEALSFDNDVKNGQAPGQRYDAISLRSIRDGPWEDRPAVLNPLVVEGFQCDNEIDSSIMPHIECDEFAFINY